MKKELRLPSASRMLRIRGRVRDGFMFSLPRHTMNTLINELERRAQRSTVTSYPRILQVEVTNRCNLNCLFCSRSSHSLQLGDFPTSLVPAIERISERVLETILFGYGEPLISEVFFTLLERVRSSRISFITNGLALTKPVQERVLTCARRPIYNIAFSIDGVRPETYTMIRERSDFGQVWANLENLAEVQKQTGRPFEVWLDFVAMRSNIAELPELIERSAALGISRINVFHLIVWDDRYRNESLLYYPELNRNYFQEARHVAAGHKIVLDLPVSIGRDPERSGRSVTPQQTVPRCTQPWSYAYIRYDGSVHACCNSEAFVMGNLHHQSFDEIWNGKHYKSFRHIVNRKLPEDCRKCELRFRYRQSPDDEKVYLKLKPRTM